MTKVIEIDGIQYTEFQIRRALALEKEVLSPNFVDKLLGKGKHVDQYSKVYGRGDS